MRNKAFFKSFYTPFFPCLLPLYILRCFTKTKVGRKNFFLPFCEQEYIPTFPPPQKKFFLPRFLFLFLRLLPPLSKMEMGNNFSISFEWKDSRRKGSGSRSRIAYYKENCKREQFKCIPYIHPLLTFFSHARPNIFNISKKIHVILFNFIYSF